jgi:hypothetical protein
VLASCYTGLGQFTEAEQLLFDSYPIVRDRKGSISVYNREILERFVNLYKVWNRPDKYEEYRELLLKTADRTTVVGK